jgi:hypothetical protein
MRESRTSMPSSQGLSGLPLDGFQWDQIGEPGDRTVCRIKST